MKRMITFFKAVVIAAFLFSCGGATDNKNNMDSVNSHDNMDMGKKSDDTVAIKEGQEVFFTNLKDGEELNGPVTVKFGVKGMDLMPLDSGVRTGAGHHHLFIDTVSFIAAGEIVPMVDNRMIHFGKGQKESKPIKLSKGKHNLSMQFADGVHRSFGIRMSKTIHISVK